MKKKNIAIIILIIITSLVLSITSSYATTSKTNTTKNNTINSSKTNSISNKSSISNTTINNSQNVLDSDNEKVTPQTQVDSLVESLSKNGLNKSNLTEAINKYKEFSKTYSNDEIADMLDKSKENLKSNNVNTENVDNVNKVLRNFDTEQLNKILNEINIDDALNEISSGSTLLDVAKNATKNMSAKEKANLVFSILWSTHIFHIIIIVIILLEIYKILIRAIIYKKAKKHAWAILIPIYRDVVMLKICGMSAWWLLLLLVPIVGWMILWVVSVASKFMLAEGFNKGAGFAFGLWLIWPIFESILAFSKNAKYIGIQK